MDDEETETAEVTVVIPVETEPAEEPPTSEDTTVVVINEEASEEVPTPTLVELVTRLTTVENIVIGLAAEVEHMAVTADVALAVAEASAVETVEEPPPAEPPAEEHSEEEETSEEPPDEEQSPRSKKTHWLTRSRAEWSEGKKNK